MEKLRKDPLIWTAFLYSLWTIIGSYYSKNGYRSSISAIFILPLLGAAYFLALNIIRHFFAAHLKKVTISVKTLCIAIGILWFTNILLCYPASAIPFDSFYIVDQYYGLFPKANNHPYLVTIIMGSLMRVGRFLLSDNFGIFLYILIQTLAMYAAVLTGVHFMKKWDIEDSRIKLVLLFYLLSPVYTIFTAVDRKDVLFSACTLLYCESFADSILRPLKSEKEKRAVTILEILAGTMCVLLWHNGLFIVVFSQIVRSIYFIRRKMPLARPITALTIIIAAFMYINYALYPQLGVAGITEERAFACGNALRFQQTARYCIKHSDEISVEDKEVIGTIFGDFDHVYNYTPNNGDALLGPADREHTKQQLRNYDRLWVKQFLDDPLVYISAHLHYVYLYMYPYEIPANSIFSISTGYANTGYFNIHRGGLSQAFVAFAKSCFDTCTSIPLLRPVYSAGMYTWIILLLVINALFSKSAGKLVIYSPIIMQVVICLGGFLPINGSLHYAFPIIYAAPFLLGVAGTPEGT